MSLYKNRLSASGTFSDSDAVAVLVDMAVCKTFFLKHLKKSRCFFLLMVRRCRDQGKLDLSVDDLVLVIFHKLKGFLNLCILCQCVEFLLNLLGNLIFHLSFLRFSILSNRSGHLRLPPVRYFITKKIFCVFLYEQKFLYREHVTAIARVQQREHFRKRRDLPVAFFHFGRSESMYMLLQTDHHLI